MLYIMKGIFHNTIIDIIEKKEGRYLVATSFSQFHLDEQSVIAIPDEIFNRHKNKLQEIDDYIKKVREKTEKLKINYYTKKLELSKAESHARKMKNELIDWIKVEVKQEINNGKNN